MKNIFTMILTCLSVIAFAQTTSDFEGFNLDAESFLNGDDGSGGFTSGNTFLQNSYNDAWESWSGWAISNTTDITTPGFMNQYSSITGAGADGSATYATTFVSGASIIELNNAAQGEKVNEITITNATYAYLSMQEGDGFAKKFGGISGDDPDFFLLTIKGYTNGELTADSVDFYLADYRFEDNSMDYIVNEWTTVDLKSLGAIDSLSFTLNSSDVSAVGMNTPGYFCVDNIVTSDGISSLWEQPARLVFEVYPNPVKDVLTIDVADNTDFEVSIIDINGRLVMTSTTNQINLAQLLAGNYFVKITSEDKVGVQRIVKL